MNKLTIIKEKWIDIKGSSAILFWIFNGKSLLSYFVRQVLLVILVIVFTFSMEFLVFLFIDHTVTFLENHWAHGS